MNQQQVELAVGAGLELLGEKSEVQIPARLNDGVFLLKQLLLAIGNGQLGLTPVMPPQAPELTPVDPTIETPPDDPKGDPEAE